jgi:hypothetical protein
MIVEATYNRSGRSPRLAVARSISNRSFISGSLSVKFLFLLFVAMLGGCATQLPMALSDATAPKTEKVTVLMSATVDNQYKPRYQPELLVVHVEKPGAKEKADRLNFKPDSTSIVPSQNEGGANTYLLSYELEPGEYLLAAMTSMARSFPIIASFQTVLMQDLAFPKAGVYYVGHVQAVVRERKDDEERAGSVIPLLDQAVAGASGGTFDVQITDRWNTDEGLFKTAYPTLARVSVEPRVLSPHDKTRVQARWDQHRQ